MPMGARHDLVEAKVLTGLVLSELTSGMVSVAVPLLVYGSTGSLTRAALVSLVGLVPTLVFGALGAPQVDRMDRRRFIVAANLARSALLVGAAMAWTYAGTAGVMAMAFVSSSLAAFEKPALRASLPDLFGDRYQEFVGRRAGLSFAVQMVAPLAGGALVGLVGGVWTLAWCATGYVAYALVAWLLPPLNTAEARAGAAGTSSWRALREAVAHVVRRPAVRTLFVYWLVSFIGVPLGTMTAVPYITTSLGHGSLAYGIASACYGPRQWCPPSSRARCASPAGPAGG